MALVVDTGNDPTPTTVQLANGSEYVIPSGDPGTFRWVRQAALIRDAYQDLGAKSDADKWDAEYQSRAAAWNAAEAAGDWASVVGQFVLDFLTAPVKIIADIGGGVLTIGRETLNRANEWAKALPWLVGGALVVLGIAAYKQDLTKFSRRRR